MSILAQRQAQRFRQSGNRPPGAALAFCIGKHAVRALVRAAVSAVLAQDGRIRADRRQNARAAVRPGIALRAADAISHHRARGDIALALIHAPRRVITGILLAFAAQQALGGFIAASAVPVRLPDHLFTKGGKVRPRQGRIRISGHKHPSRASYAADARRVPKIKTYALQIAHFCI